MINEYPESDTQKFSVHNVGEVAFMRLTTEYELLDGHLPIWRQVIAGSIMNIDKMYFIIVLDYFILKVECFTNNSLF